jgi:hypothetical protein
MPEFMRDYEPLLPFKVYPAINRDDGCRAFPYDAPVHALQRLVAHFRILEQSDTLNVDFIRFEDAQLVQ